jgi:hypothetical protein
MAQFSTRSDMEPAIYEFLVRKIRDFQQDRTGPSDMWLPLFGTLPADSARTFLDSLPDDLKFLIRREYFGLAHYRFRPPQGTADLEVSKVIAKWCEEQGDPDALPN